MRRRIAKLITGSLLIVTLYACGKQNVADRTYAVSEDDPAMNAAMAQARSSVQDFIKSLQSPRPDQDGFSVKTAISEGEHVEYFWLWPVKFDGTNFVGMINNKPEKVTNVKLGQPMSIAPQEIADWMFLEKGKLMGGYSIRVLRDKMTPEERAEFDANTPFQID